MIGGLAAALAAQLTLAAGAKWRTRDEPTPTLLSTLLPAAGVALFIAADVICAALLLLPGTAAAGALVVLAAAAGSTVIGIVRPESGARPCGCFGLPAPHQPRWRAELARVLMAAEAVPVVLAPVGGPVLAGPAWWLAGLVATGVFVGLQPQVVRPYRGGLAPAEAVRALATSQELEPWRPMLLSEIPAEVTTAGTSVRIVLDAWSGDRPLLLIATVTGRRVRIRPYDAQTLAPAPGHGPAVR